MSLKSGHKGLAMLAFTSTLAMFSGELSQAGTYWISPTGVAVWSNCQGTTPLNGTSACSAKTAMANAMADDVVKFRGGTYNVGPDPGDGYQGALQPSHSGTSGHPIIFQAYTGEVPILACDWNNNANNMCRALGTGGGTIEYITYDGFTIMASDGIHAGSISLGGSGAPATHGFTVKNNTVIGGDSAPTSYDDNFEGIRTTWVSDSSITNNKVYGFRRTDRGGSNDNFACIKIYGTSNINISNNDIHNCNTGISVKRPSDSLVIAYNYIYSGVNTGILWNINTGVTYGSNGWTIHNNVINLTPAAGTGSGCLNGSADNGSYTNDSFVIYNNTCRNLNDTGAYLGLMTKLTLYNNVFIAKQASDYGLFNTVRNVSTISAEDHNQWGTNPFLIQVRRYESYANYTSLSSWQSSTELLGGGHPGSGDLTSDPLFLNASGTFSLLSDFALSAGSPCNTAGRGGVAIGADISKVGTGTITVPLANIGSGGTPPQAPTGLRIL